MQKQYWWEVKEKVHETIFGIVRFLDQNQSYRQQANLRNMRLYGNLNVMGLTAHTYSQSPMINNPYDRVTLNIVQSMCDTVTQKIAKNRVKPTFLTSGGDWTMKRKAKRLDKFILGLFYGVGFAPKAVRAFLHSTVLGTGALHIYRSGDDICVDNVFIDELKVDDREAMYGDPRSLYRTKYIDRSVLARIYPKHEADIMMAKQADNNGPMHSNLSDCVNVIEAWHLPSAKGMKDGRHCIICDSCTLIDEKWERDYFPFVFLRWSERLLGFWGQALAEQLTGLQIEINKILRTIQLAFHLVVPKLLLEKGSKIVKAHLNNEIGGIVEYTGIKPEVWAPSTVAPELFNHLERLYQKSYEIAGVSQLSAQSKKPGGLDSGKALREFNDIESERFIIVGQNWEQFHVDCAKQMINLAKEIHADLKERGEPGYVATSRSRKFIEKINWDEIDLAEDQYVMQCFPSSMLSNTPAGRLQDVQELMQAGFIDKANGQRLLDFPDLESYTDLATAGVEDIENNIEAILERGEYSPPEPFQDIHTALTMMQSAYLKARMDNAPEENLELLRRWMSEAQAMTNPPPVAGPGMPGGAPQAVPVAPPTSALLPNAPTQGMA